MSNVDLIREWIESNPSPAFPPSIEDMMIERFLYVCGNNVQRTKEVITLFFKFRFENPEIFTNRDPLQKNLQDIFDVVGVYPLPKKTEEGYQVYISRFLDSNPDKFNFLNYTKMFFNISDVRMKTEEKIPPGDIPIFDMSGFTFRHLMNLIFSPALVKKYMKITQEAHPVSLKQIHVINTSSLLEKLLTFLRPLMREEVKNLIHFHGEGSPTLFQFISPDIIPTDLGGKGVPLEDLKAHWKKQIEFQRDWLMTNPWRNNTDCEMKESERERNAVKNQKSGQTLKSLEFD